MAYTYCFTTCTESAKDQVQVILQVMETSMHLLQCSTWPHYTAEVWSVCPSPGMCSVQAKHAAAPACAALSTQHAHSGEAETVMMSP